MPQSTSSGSRETPTVCPEVPVRMSARTSMVYVPPAGIVKRPEASFQEITPLETVAESLKRFHPSNK